MDRRDIGSWLAGPGSVAGAEAGTAEQRFRGERLGLPESGLGSLAGWGRRAVAITIDWLASLAITNLVFHDASSGARSLITMAVFAGQVALLTILSGSSFGQKILGLGVRRVDGSPLAPIPTVVRTILICLAVPPLIWDADGRGLHDKAAGSIVVNTRR